MERYNRQFIFQAVSVLEVFTQSSGKKPWKKETAFENYAQMGEY
jgi:hypothetical protein